MIRDISQMRNIYGMPATVTDISPILEMVNNFFSVLNVSIARIRERFHDRDIRLTVNEVIEGKISWTVRMQWSSETPRRQHEKVMNGLFEIPATTEMRPTMEMQYRHYIIVDAQDRQLAEFDEMWYNTITYVRMLEFIQAFETWMMSVELDHS